MKKTSNLEYMGNPKTLAEIEIIREKINKEIKSLPTKQVKKGFVRFNEYAHSNQPIKLNIADIDTFDLAQLLSLFAQKNYSLCLGKNTSRGMKYAKQRKEQSANLSQLGA